MLKPLGKERNVKSRTNSSKMQMKPPETRREGQRRISSAVEQQINENLKLLYERQVQEELPDNLKALVARLRDESSRK